MIDADIAVLETLIRDVVRHEVETAVAAVLVALEGRGQPVRRALPPGVSEFDCELARQVEAAWRDQGRRPVSTAAMATRLGYSHSYTMVLLKDAERAGAVASIPGRGRRHSGRWLPISARAL